jgi:hypothetical protein
MALVTSHFLLFHSYLFLYLSITGRSPYMILRSSRYATSKIVYETPEDAKYQLEKHRGLCLCRKLGKFPTLNEFIIYTRTLSSTILSRSIYVTDIIETMPTLKPLPRSLSFHYSHSHITLPLLQTPNLLNLLTPINNTDSLSPKFINLLL